jgi:hypothetical protein
LYFVKGIPYGKMFKIKGVDLNNPLKTPDILPVLAARFKWQQLQVVSFQNISETWYGSLDRVADHILKTLLVFKGIMGFMFYVMHKFFVQ